MVQPVVYNQFPLLAANKSDQKHSQTLNLDNWGIIFYENNQQTVSRQPLFKLTKLEGLAGASNETLLNANVETGGFGLAVNDILKIKGKGYKINSFDLDINETEILVCVAVNEV